jgi:hypothetical protein
MIREIEIVSVGSIETLLEEMVPRLGFQRSPVYRGQASADWKLLPPLYREEVAKTDQKSWAELEAAFLFSLKQGARGELAHDPVTELEWMALGAHHGLPTRFSSWSENALVALFYATDPAFPNVDGVVWRIMPGEASFTISHDFEQIPEQPRLYRPARPDLTMRNQRVCFLSHPLPKEDAAPETFEEVYELGSDRLVLSKLVIPADWKGYLRRRLADMGVDHRLLNPGLGSICRDLREQIYCHTDSYEWIFPE